MAFVPVPKDLNRVKTKVMFNLTKRQLICFSIAAAVGVPIFFLAKAHLDLSTAAMLMVVIMLPFIFFALYEKDGQPAEKYLLQKELYEKPDLVLVRSHSLTYISDVTVQVITNAQQNREGHFFPLIQFCPCSGRQPYFMS